MATVAIVEMDIRSWESRTEQVCREYRDADKDRRLKGLALGELAHDTDQQHTNNGVVRMSLRIRAKYDISQQLWSKWKIRYEESIGLIDIKPPQIEDSPLPDKPHVTHNSRNNEWYTPPKYIEAARRVMGEIDLDPATCPFAQETIKAAEFFTEQTNGLDKHWAGRVWLNPPYSSDLVFPFIKKLVDELESGRVSEAILLTHNATDTAWFHVAEEIAAAICFTRGRIHFVTQDGEGGSPLQGQAFFYFGENIGEFRTRFSDFGFIR